MKKRKKDKEEESKKKNKNEEEERKKKEIKAENIWLHKHFLKLAPSLHIHIFLFPFLSHFFRKNLKNKRKTFFSSAFLKMILSLTLPLSPSLPLSHSVMFLSLSLCLSVSLSLCLSVSLSLCLSLYLNLYLKY